MTRVNVLLPAYEPKKEHICAAVESVLNQSTTDFKLHIQDDCSKYEDTKNHISKYLDNSRVSFKVNKKNLGIGPNWNKCLEFGDSQYIAYLFHDDIWDPKYLEKMSKVLDENDDIGFVSARHSYIKDDDYIDTSSYDGLKTFVKNNILSGHNNGRELLLWWAEKGLTPNIIGEPSFVMFRRKLIEEVGPFHETMPQFLDSEYSIRCLLKTNWYYLDEDLGSFRIHKAAASAQNEEKGLGKFDRFECFQMLIKKSKKEDKAKLKQSFQKAFDGMIKKYIKRRGKGKSVSTKGSGAFKKFLLRHPLFVFRTIFRNK
ncbi:MAG: glycosyltransferase [Candidatus Peribacteraceae bacterium]|nr:glycosyltransferase [Candidatus Peribacteraceae bacterium]